MQQLVRPHSDLQALAQKIFGRSILTATYDALTENSRWLRLYSDTQTFSRNSVGGSVLTMTYTRSCGNFSVAASFSVAPSLQRPTNARADSHRKFSAAPSVSVTRSTNAPTENSQKLHPNSDLQTLAQKFLGRPVISATYRRPQRKFSMAPSSQRSTGDRTDFFQ